VTIEVKPTYGFEDMATMFAPKDPQSSVCWCLSWRLSSAENRELKGTDRADTVRELCSREFAPGVLVHIHGEVAGWHRSALRAAPLH